MQLTRRQIAAGIAAAFVVVVLIIIIVSVVVDKKSKKDKKDADGFCSIRDAVAHDHAIAARRGARHDATRQPSAYTDEALADNYSKWSAEPRDLEKAAREAWLETTSSGGTPGSYTPDMSGDAGASMSAYHEHSPDINHQDGLIDLVATPEIRANHAAWVAETKPYASNVLRAEDADELSVFNLGHSRVGLGSFRLAGPRVSSNPLFITENDDRDFARQGSENFRFGG